MGLETKDGKPYPISKPENNIQSEGKRAAERARRSARGKISVPDRLSIIEGKLDRILDILNNSKAL